MTGKGRAENDARLEYMYSFLAQSSELSRDKVSQQIHEASLVPKINALFQPRSPKTLLLYYQDEPVGTDSGSGSTAVMKKRLLDPNGHSKVLTGIAMFYFRTSNAKPITEGNYCKELMCGTVDGRKAGGTLLNFWKTIELVYIPSLLGLARGQDGASKMVPALRSFCSAIRVLELIQKDYHTLVVTQPVFYGHEQIADIRKYARMPEKLQILERTVKTWTDTVTQLVSESDRLRKEGDSDGPQDEVEYWKHRTAQFALLSQRIHSGEMKYTILCLQLAGSNALKVWKSLESRVNYVFNEAKDTAAYIDRIDKVAHSLYLEYPVKIKGDVKMLMQTVMMIQTSSTYYNTSEKISHLLVKITNQMIHRCKIFLTNGFAKSDFWSQPRSGIHSKISDCIELNRAYKKAHKNFSAKSKGMKSGKDICKISEHYVFGKFDKFCGRLRKILSVFRTLDGFEALFTTNVFGLLWGDHFEEMEKEFNGMVKSLSTKNYDYLDYRNYGVDVDFDIFIERTEEMKLALSKLIEKKYWDTWESPQAIKILKKFEQVNKYVELCTVDDKYDRIADYFLGRIRYAREIFHHKKRNGNVPRGMPPVGGKVMWIRAMAMQLEPFTKEFASHSKLRELPQYKVLVREYNGFAMEAATFEIRFLRKWEKACKLSTVEEPLTHSLLKYENIEKLIINLSPTIISSIAEGDCLSKMKCDVPLPAKVLLLKSSHFQNVSERLDMLLELFTCGVQRVKTEIRPLLFPQVVKLASLLHPAVTDINWTSSLWTNYYKLCINSMNDFNTLVTQVHDVFDHQISRTFDDIQDIIFCAEFVQLPWTLDDFLEKSYKTVREAAELFNNKSLHIRDLVDELIQLINQSGKKIGTEIIQEFNLDKQLPLLAELLEATSFNTSSESSGGSPGSQPDWSIVDQLFNSPHLIYGFLVGKCSIEMNQLVKNSNEDVKCHFSNQLFDILVQSIKTSLELIRQRFLGSKGSKGSSMFHLEGTSFFQDKPVFIMETELQGSTIIIKPTIEQIQETISQVGQIIVSGAKGIEQWNSYGLENHDEFPQKTDDKITRRRKLYRSISEDRTGAQVRPFNYFSQVLENKEITKLTAALANCTQPLRESLQEFVEIWTSFDSLWSPQRYIIAKEFAHQNPSWMDFEEKLVEIQETATKLQSLSDYYDFGAIRIMADILKKCLISECRQLILRHGTHLKNRYKREMIFVIITLQHFQKKLEVRIETVDDIRVAMDNLMKFRECEVCHMNCDFFNVDLDLKIPPIEEAFYVVAKFNIPAVQDEHEEADGLRCMFQKLQDKAIRMSATIVTLKSKSITPMN